MRVADIAIFIFMFQAVLGFLNTISFINAGEISSVNVNETINKINETVKDYSVNIDCSSLDFACQVSLAAKQFYLTFIKPAGDLIWAFSKAVFIGELLRDMLKPIDPNNSMNGLYLALDGIGGMIFMYGLAQFIRGVGFKVSR